MKKPLALVPLLTALAAGCATGGPAPSPSQLTETEAAIRSAENAGAAQLASDLLDRARKSLASARAAAGRGENDQARQQVEEARAFAAAAEMRARAEAVKRQAGDLRRQADELEARARQIQAQPRSER